MELLFFVLGDTMIPMTVDDPEVTVASKLHTTIQQCCMLLRVVAFFNFNI
jgi:hypothetical protein